MRLGRAGTAVALGQGERARKVEAGLRRGVGDLFFSSLDSLALLLVAQTNAANHQEGHGHKRNYANRDYLRHPQRGFLFFCRLAQSETDQDKLTQHLGPR